MNHGLVIDYNSVAAYLAHEDAKVQAAFLDTFVKELTVTCQTRHHAEMQMDYIRSEAKPETIEAFKMFTFEEARP